MRLVNALYRRFKRLIHQLARFGTVGAFAYVVQVATTNLFFGVLSWPPLVAQGLGALISMIVAFFGHRQWTFHDRTRTNVHREYTLFFIMNGVGMLIQLLCVGMAVYVLGFESGLAYNIAGNFVGVALGSLFRFWSYRRWVFPEPTSPGARESDGQQDADSSARSGNA